MLEKGGANFERIDISSHSAFLLNERLASLFEIAHEAGISFDTNPSFASLCKYQSCLKHIWLYVRQIVASDNIRVKVDNELFAVQDWIRMNQQMLITGSSGERAGVNYKEMIRVADVLDRTFDMINKILQRGSRYFFRTSNYFFSDKLVEDFAKIMGVVEEDVDKSLEIDESVSSKDEVEVEDVLKEAEQKKKGVKDGISDKQTAGE